MSIKEFASTHGWTEKGKERKSAMFFFLEVIRFFFRSVLFINSKFFAGSFDIFAFPRFRSMFVLMKILYI